MPPDDHKQIIKPSKAGTGDGALARYLPFSVRLIHALTGRRMLKVLIGGMLVIGVASGVAAQTGLPTVTIGVNPSKNPKDVAVSLQLLLLLTVLTLAPSILIMTTAFTRIVIVLSIMRSAIGMPQVPPTQVLAGLALFLTFFVMRPTFQAVHEEALAPYFKNQIDFQTAMDRAIKPIRSFMIRQTYTKDLQFFINLAKLKRPPTTPSDVPITVVIPAFITSELKTAFIMGFYIFLPFLVIDMVVASTLMSMGMMMLPPTIIALPAKLLLFVMANGWTLLLGSLVKGFR
jgi:flagellar biosynthetic protein FliP